MSEMQILAFLQVLKKSFYLLLFFSAWWTPVPWVLILYVVRFSPIYFHILDFTFKPEEKNWQIETLGPRYRKIINYFPMSQVNYQAQILTIMKKRYLLEDYFEMKYFCENLNIMAIFLL